VTDPIESLIVSAMEVQRAYVQASLVDRIALAEHQSRNDAAMGLATVKQAFRADVTLILGMARLVRGGAIGPLAVCRSSGYRQRMADMHPTDSRRGAGIV
jgi:L-rhamnose isomerase/sugar isomerase